MVERDRRRGLLDASLLVLVAAPVLFVAGIILVSSGLLGFGGPEPRPPQGTLAYGGESEVGSATIGCWREKRRLLPDNTACVSSMTGFSTSEPRLRVPSGARMEFVYGGGSAPEEIGARAYRTDVPPTSGPAEEQGGPPVKPGEHLGPLEFEEERLTPVQQDKRAFISADLPPGRYMLIVSVRVNDETAEGEAHYDFEVAVE